MPIFSDTSASDARVGRSSAPLIAYILKQRSTAFRIFLLVVVVAGVTLVRAVFGLALPHAGFFAFYFPAVMVVTILTGWQMGLICIAASVVVATWLFMPPAEALAMPTFGQWLNIASFVGAALLQLALAQWLRSVLQQMERNENRYRQLVAATSGIVLTASAEGNIVEPQSGWSEITGVKWPAYRGDRWTQNIHAEDRGKLVFGSWTVDSPKVHHTDVRIWHAASNDWRWFGVRAVPINDASGNPREWVIIITDIHDRRLARDRREMVIGELRHRLKNLFTVIGSLAQSSRPRNNPDVDQFLSKLMGRLHALSAAADLVMARGKVTLELGEIARATLAPFTEDQGSRISIDGLPIELSEETGGAIALAIHELATNALKYGALSVPEGKVQLNWRYSSVADGDKVEIEWKETSGPRCETPTKLGFGTRVIKFAAAREKSGEVMLDFPPDGLCCRIAFVKPAEAPGDAPPAFGDLGIL